jgi:hypothetical protein
MIVVCIWCPTNATITSVTYGGTGLTKAASASAAPGEVHIYYLAGVSSSQTVQINFTAKANYAASSTDWWTTADVVDYYQYDNTGGSSIYHNHVGGGNQEVIVKNNPTPNDHLIGACCASKTITSCTDTFLFNTSSGGDYMAFMYQDVAANGNYIGMGFAASGTGVLLTCRIPGLCEFREEGKPCGPSPPEPVNVMQYS